MLYDLRPIHQKSFYGKAQVFKAQDGTETLFSYGTPILQRDNSGNLTRLWGGWSQTTGKHIKVFCGLNKKEFFALPHDLTPAEKAAAYSGTLYR